MSTAFDRALDEIDALYRRRRAEAKAELRRERRDRIALFAKHPTSLWGFVNLFAPTPMLSCDEAGRYHGRRARIHRKRIRDDHWLADRGSFALHYERAIVARYFRRFGGRIWQKRAA